MTVKSAWQAYDAAIEPAWQAYVAAVKPARQAYDAAIEPAWQAYVAAVDHELHGGAAGSFAAEGCALCAEADARAEVAR